MKQMRIGFVANIQNPGDVDLNNLMRLLYASGFTLDSVNVYDMAGQIGVAPGGLPSGNAQQAASGAVAPQQQAVVGGKDATEEAERKSTRGKKATTETASDPKPTEPAKTTATASATVQTLARDADAKALELELRGVLSPLVEAGRTADVNAFITGLGYAKVSAIPNEALEDVLMKAKGKFKPAALD